MRRHHGIFLLGMLGCISGCAQGTQCSELKGGGVCKTYCDNLQVNLGPTACDSGFVCCATEALTTSITCPPGYTSVDFKCLQLVGPGPNRGNDQQRTWEGAKGECERRGAVLAQLNDYTFYRVVNYVHPLDKIKGWTYPWVGARQYPDNSYKWTATEVIVSEWEPTEPNGKGKNNCVELGWDGKYYDDPCDALREFLCQVPVVNVVLGETTSIQSCTGENCKACASFGGVFIDNDRFENTCLKFSEETLDWSKAAAACAETGGHLASMTSTAKAEAVRNYAAQNYGRTQFWAGGSDIANEGSWVWHNGDPFHSRFPWSGVEPNNAFANDNGEDCLLVNYSDGPGYYDWGCQNHARYICELGAGKPGACPTPRHICRPAYYSRPSVCTTDFRCPGAEKCCYDRCVGYTICKTPHF